MYSSKFTLSVVDLNQIELATQEDKNAGIDYWARVFKAKTWEELKMLAKNNEYLEEAAASIYRANAEEIVRQQCLAREDAERRERTLVRDNKLLKKDITKLQENNNNLQETNIKLQKDITTLKARILELEKGIPIRD